MMVDGGAAVYSTQLQKMIAEEIGDQKVRILFNTHWHWDHVGSNELLGEKGTVILAQENTRSRLNQKIFVEVRKTTIDPLKPEGLPSKTFLHDGELSFGKEKIEYVHVPLSHTDGDAYIFFPEANVLHTGDMFRHLGVHGRLHKRRDRS
jgi:glyoxylase-like metal-dependent hydrolase (beta-lactamase superfamily II)